MNNRFVRSTVLLLTGVAASLSLNERTYAGECDHKSVADCADLLAEKVDSLIKENDSLKADLKKITNDFNTRLSSIPRVITGHSAIDKTIGHVHVSFPAGFFTRPPSVNVAISSFFGGIIKGNYYEASISVPDNEIHTDGFNIYMDSGVFGQNTTAQPNGIFWVAVQNSK